MLLSIVPDLITTGTNELILRDYLGIPMQSFWNIGENTDEMFSWFPV